MSDVPPPVPPKPPARQLPKNPLPVPPKPPQSKADHVPSQKRQARPWPPQSTIHAFPSASISTSKQPELTDTSDWRYSKGLDAKWSPYNDFVVIERRKRSPEASSMRRQRSQSTSAAEHPCPAPSPQPHATHAPSCSAFALPGRSGAPAVHWRPGPGSRSKLDGSGTPERSLTTQQPAQIQPRSRFDLGAFAWEAPFPRSKLSQSSPNLAGQNMASIYGARSGSTTYEDARWSARR